MLLHMITCQYVITKTGNLFNYVVFLDFEMMKFQKNVEIFTQILRFFKNTTCEMVDCGRSRQPVLVGLLSFNYD